jgi:tetratricopeptide (TPR) repeat protein
MVAVAAVALGYATVRRNDDYKSELAMWSDIVAKRPDNARAQFSLGVTLSKAGRFVKRSSLLARVRLRPDAAEAHSDIGVRLYREGRKEEGLGHLFEGVRLKPDYADGQNNLGVALYLEGRVDEAITHYSAAIPREARVRGSASEPRRRPGPARTNRSRDRRVSTALRLKPDYPDAHNNLGQSAAPHRSKRRSDLALAEAVRILPVSAKRALICARQARKEHGKARP